MIFSLRVSLQCLRQVETSQLLEAGSESGLLCIKGSIKVRRVVSLSEVGQGCKKRREFVACGAGGVKSVLLCEGLPQDGRTVVVTEWLELLALLLEFGNGILMLPELRHARNACVPSPSGLLRAVWIHLGAERTWSLPQLEQYYRHKRNYIGNISTVHTYVSRCEVGDCCI